MEVVTLLLPPSWMCTPSTSLSTAWSTCSPALISAPHSAALRLMPFLVGARAPVDLFCLFGWRGVGVC